MLLCYGILCEVKHTMAEQWYGIGTFLRVKVTLPLIVVSVLCLFCEIYVLK